MGATTFHNATEGADATQAFQELREICLHEYGHGGYTGTIAEKDEFVVITEKPLTEQNASELANKLINDGDSRIDDKWGPAGAIPLKDGPRDREITGWLFFGWASE